MMSDAVTIPDCYDNRKTNASPVPKSVIELCDYKALWSPPMRTAELLTMLRERDIKNGQIAKALNLTPSRVTEIFAGDRRVSLDEAATLIEVFNLDEPTPPIEAHTARLLVIYVASQIGVALDGADPRVELLAQDMSAFAQFAADPELRDKTDSLLAFLRGRASTTPRKAITA